jgi:hypothetical protein
MCELYVDALSDVSDINANESLDSDSDVPSTSLCKQIRSCGVVTVKQVQKRKKIVNW